MINHLTNKIMGNLTPRPAPQVKQRPLTDEEKKERVIRFLAQKREQYAISILSGMVQGAVTNKDVTNFQCKSLVDLAVEMADALLEKLYPLTDGGQSDGE